MIRYPHLNCSVFRFLGLLGGQRHIAFTNRRDYVRRTEANYSKTRIWTTNMRSHDEPLKVLFGTFFLLCRFVALPSGNHAFLIIRSWAGSILNNYLKFWIANASVKVFLVFSGMRRVPQKGARGTTCK